MVGDVEAKGLFLPLQALALIFLDVWKLGPGRRELGRIEHRELVLMRTFQAPCRPFDSLGVDRDHRGPRGADVVEGTALYEGFQSPLVVRLGVDALAEVEDVLEGPTLLPGGDDRIYARIPDVLDGGEPETDGLPDHRKAAPALVYVGREDLYLHRPGLSDVLGHPIFGVHHAAHEGRHIRLGIVGFEVGGLEGEERVACAVALVEGVSPAFSIQFHSSSAPSVETPLAAQPAMNLSLSVASIAAFFLPMALRSMSASPGVNPPRDLEISINCSW